MLRLLAPILVPKILEAELRHQRKIGYRLEFGDLPSDWLKSYMLADMTKAWHAYGLPISGLNYFTLGAIKNGLSTRFIPGEPLYQAWLGGYIFTFDEPADWLAQDYLKLCEADQKKWLWYYGVQNPKMDFGKATSARDLELGGTQGRLYEWSGKTQSDVGEHSSRLYNRATMDGMAYIMNQLNPNQQLRGANFVPRHHGKTDYEEITISGYVAIMDIKPNTKAVLYVCMNGRDKANKAAMKDLISQKLRIIKA